MKCGYCGGKIGSQFGRFEWSDKYAGTLILDNAAYNRCDNCGKILLPPATLRALASVKNTKIQQWLLSRPLKDFWDSRRVADFFGITRQALSKGVRYHNLAYHVTHAGRILYLADSVEKLARTGDGRIELESVAETKVISTAKKTVSDFDDTEMLQHIEFPLSRAFK